jgi:hypothetical protein
MAERVEHEKAEMTDAEVKRLALEELDYLTRGRKLPARFRSVGSFCNECESPRREWYHMRNDVWQKVNPVRHGHLCIPCLKSRAQKRLGRPLRRGDFGQLPSDEDGNPIPLPLS